MMPRLLEMLILLPGQSAHTGKSLMVTFPILSCSVTGSGQAVKFADRSPDSYWSVGSARSQNSTLPPFQR
jgi:hypothetical protein